MRETNVARLVCTVSRFIEMRHTTFGTGVDVVLQGYLVKRRGCSSEVKSGQRDESEACVNCNELNSR